MKSYGLNKIESVSEVDEMKKERGFVGLGLALVINYMMHQMAGPAIYFGVVLCGLMVFYGKVDMEKVKDMVRFYNGRNEKIYSTYHGCFYDVIPFSMDNKIKEVSMYRIEQSIVIAKSLGAKAVVFHTNYNPFFKTKEYIDDWLNICEEFWGSILKKYKDINIYLENMFDDNPDVLEQLAHRLSVYENFGLCLINVLKCKIKINLKLI